MVMMVEPLDLAVRSLKSVMPEGTRTLLMSPQGRRFNQAYARELSAEPGLLMVCGRYEGVDERVVPLLIDEEVSIGDYVISGGEIAAMVVMDAVSRLIPGVLGHEGSAIEDSFSEGLLDCPHYTRPPSYRGLDVPEVLLSGDHGRIREWRADQSRSRTEKRRPDLWSKTGMQSGEG